MPDPIKISVFNCPVPAFSGDYKEAKTNLMEHLLNYLFGIHSSFIKRPLKVWVAGDDVNGFAIISETFEIKNGDYINESHPFLSRLPVTATKRKLEIPFRVNLIMALILADQPSLLETALSLSQSHQVKFDKPESCIDFRDTYFENPGLQFNQIIAARSARVINTLLQYQKPTNSEIADLITIPDDALFHPWRVSFLEIIFQQQANILNKSFLTKLALTMLDKDNLQRVLQWGDQCFQRKVLNYIFSSVYDCADVSPKEYLVLLNAVFRVYEVQLDPSIIDLATQKVLGVLFTAEEFPIKSKLSVGKLLARLYNSNLRKGGTVVPELEDLAKRGNIIAHCLLATKSQQNEMATSFDNMVAAAKAHYLPSTHIVYRAISDAFREKAHGFDHSSKIKFSHLKLSFFIGDTVIHKDIPSYLIKALEYKACSFSDAIDLLPNVKLEKSALDLLHNDIIAYACLQSRESSNLKKALSSLETRHQKSDPAAVCLMAMLQDNYNPKSPNFYMREAGKLLPLNTYAWQLHFARSICFKETSWGSNSLKRCIYLATAAVLMPQNRDDLFSEFAKQEILTSLKSYSNSSDSVLKAVATYLLDIVLGNTAVFLENSGKKTPELIDQIITAEQKEFLLPADIKDKLNPAGAQVVHAEQEFIKLPPVTAVVSSIPPPSSNNTAEPLASSQEQTGSKEAEAIATPQQRQQLNPDQLPLSQQLVTLFATKTNNLSAEDLKQLTRAFGSGLNQFKALNQPGSRRSFP